MTRAAPWAAYKKGPGPGSIPARPFLLNAVDGGAASPDAVVYSDGASSTRIDL
jgi:hypothetical protein